MTNKTIATVGPADGKPCKRGPEEPKIASQSSASNGLMNGKEFQSGALRAILIMAKIVRNTPRVVPKLIKIIIQCGCFPLGENT